MNKTRFFIQPEEGDNVDKIVKKWRKKIDSTKLLKKLKAIRYFEKPKEKRKHQYDFRCCSFSKRSAVFSGNR